jgi:hypothetical protein
MGTARLGPASGVAQIDDRHSGAQSSVPLLAWPRASCHPSRVACNTHGHQGARLRCASATERGRCRRSPSGRKAAAMTHAELTPLPRERESADHWVRAPGTHHRTQKPTNQESVDSGCGLVAGGESNSACLLRAAPHRTKRQPANLLPHTQDLESLLAVREDSDALD